MSQQQGSGPDFFENWFEKRKQERLAAAKRRRRRDGIVLAVLLAVAVAAFFVVKNVEEAEENPSQGAPGDTAAPGLTSPATPPSHGITQAQLDALGDSIEARYASGDTEVAEALLDNFMQAHPECVSAVMAGGEGRMPDVLHQSEAVAKYLKETAPYPNSYTTVITNRVDGVVKAAVLGVSCKDA